MEAAPAPADARPEPGDLSGWVERGLALRAGPGGPVDPAEVQRLLKQLRRLEPAARQALSDASSPAGAQDFAACLRSLT